MGRGAAATKATVAPAPPITEATRAAVLNKIEEQRACLEARGEERGPSDGARRMGRGTAQPRALPFTLFLSLSPSSPHTVEAHIAAIYAERDTFIAAVRARRAEVEDRFPEEVRNRRGERRVRALSSPGAPTS